MLADEMELGERALHTLQRALAADVENSALRTELAKRLRLAGHYPQALIELRRLLEADVTKIETVSYTHLRAHETVLDIVCRLLLVKKNTTHNTHNTHTLLLNVYSIQLPVLANIHH